MSEFKVDDVVQVVNTKGFCDKYVFCSKESETVTRDFYQSLGVIVKVEPSIPTRYKSLYSPIHEYHVMLFDSGEGRTETFAFHDYNLNYIGEL